MLAFGSPIWAETIRPPLRTSSGLTPKYAGLYSTRSASLPPSMLPTCSAMPWVIAGLIVYLATYRLTRSLSLRVLSPASGPSCTFILWAVCQQRTIASPIRPIACESELIMLMMPRSWKTSSAPIVSARMRLSANATSSGMSRDR